jgi:hypothetical protein
VRAIKPLFLLLKMLGRENQSLMPERFESPHND